jgi:gamma-glutamyl:cysteine ligase YbdK (ATP-grasp superfamily)
MSGPFPLFARFGVELEYMIVDGDTLDVLPVADEVLRAEAGEYTSDFEAGALTWCNELVLHVIELKTTSPATALEGLAAAFHQDVGRINALARALGGRLLPTAMHPWMDPFREARLWPHECSPIYEAFHRIFDCRGHGWSNLQALHLNLPFANDEEFGRLHAAIRLVLPILPALAAGSPVCDGRPSGLLDARLDAYRHNARRVPSVSGRVIPEPVYTRAEYEEHILGMIYRDLAPLDPDGILRHEWVNARGAIARFDRQTIEIRVLDMQECPAADLAILELIAAVLRAMTEERWGRYAEQRAWPVEPLADLLLAAVRDAELTRIASPAYLRLFGMEGVQECTAGELWGHLRAALGPAAVTEAANGPLDVILREGCLARRILRALPGNPPPEALRAVYRELARCLVENRLFRP